MASNIVPCYAIAVFIVLHGEAGLVVVFLEAFDGNSDIKFSIDRTFFDTFKVIGLRSTGPEKVEFLLSLYFLV